MRVRRERELGQRQEEKRKRAERQTLSDTQQLRLSAFFASLGSAVAKPVEPLSDYASVFRPFFLRQNCSLAPPHKFHKSHSLVRSAIDCCISNPQLPPPLSLSPPTSSPPSKPLRYYKDSCLPFPPSLKSRHLQFHSDVRPPYHGTISMLIPPKALFRNPFKRLLPLLYDYDSEAEWVEDDEPGEDLVSDEDEDSDGVLSEDDQRFLDDEDDIDQGKRRVIIDLTPVIQGPCTESQISTGVWECLLDCPPPNGIDPFHNYWSDSPQDIPPSMPPPNSCPLQSNLKKKLQTFPQDRLVDFIRLVKGSQEPKILLVQLLKKQFPTITKAIIAEKLNQVAKRTGRKETDVWVLTPEMELALSTAEQN